MNSIDIYPVTIPFPPVPGGMILMYHRVADLATDPQLLAVSPAHFAEHLEVLRQIMRPLRLPDLLAAAQAEELPPNAVAITFDDGYADNALHAQPLLRQFQIPATFFISTGYIEGNREPFWDELDRVLLQPGTLPLDIQLNTAGLSYHGYLGDSAVYAPEAYQRHRLWNVLSPENPTPRQKIYRELCELLHRATSAQRAQALDVLRAWAGMPAVCRESHQMMNLTQLRALAAGDLLEIGAHTVTHPLLTMENLADQSRELIRSKMRLEEILERPVHGFSYPFGTRHDYTPDTVDAVRAAGYQYACSNYQGRIGSAADAYQLPRFIVRDWDGQEFARRLEAWRQSPLVAPPAPPVKIPRFQRVLRSATRVRASF